MKVVLLLRLQEDEQRSGNLLIFLATGAVGNGSVSAIMELRADATSIDATHEKVQGVVFHIEHGFDEIIGNILVMTLATSPNMLALSSPEHCARFCNHPHRT